MSAVTYLRSVALLEVTIKGEGRYLGRFNGGEEDLARGGVPPGVGGHAPVLLAVHLLHLPDQETAVAQGGGPRTCDQLVVNPPINLGIN